MEREREVEKEGGNNEQVVEKKEVKGKKIVGFLLSLMRRVPQFLDGLQEEKAWITAFGVLPESRHLGIGSALFDAALKRFNCFSRKEIAISPYTPNYFIPGIDTEKYPEAIAFLHKRGWTVSSTPISMRADTAGMQTPIEVMEIETALQREGYHFRQIESNDIANLLQFISKTFSWDWVRFCQDYLSELFGSGSDQICIYIATRTKVSQGQDEGEEEEEIVGYCQQRRERFGPFGVDPSMRSRGLGRILLFKCLSEMSAKGFHCAWFLWTDKEAARLYSVAGFKPVRTFSIMKLELAK